MQATLLLLSAILTIVASCIYCVSILKGRTKPHRITRLVLFFVLTLNFVSVLAAEGNLGAELYAGIISFFGAAFFFLSLKRGMGGATVFDWVCFAIAMVGVVGWQITGNAVLSIWLAAIADLVAYMPAFVKTWKFPDTESPWLYILSGLGAILGMIPYKVTAVSIFQISVIGCAVVMLFCIYHRKFLQLLNKD